VANFVHDPSVTSPKLTDAMKVVIFQLSYFGFLGEESLQPLFLLII
jgi:hypothetical protein